MPQFWPSVGEVTVTALTARAKRGAMVKNLASILN